MSEIATVKFLNDEKGIGFFVQDDGGPDMLVHRNQTESVGHLKVDEQRFEESTDDRNGKWKVTRVTGERIRQCSASLCRASSSWRHQETTEPTVSGHELNLKGTRANKS